jgi:peptide-methionine (S)-S-oxide reductase
MTRSVARTLAALVVALPLAAVVARGSANAAAPRLAPAPAPAAAVRAEPGARLETAVLAGGCFWGVEAVYEHIKGVTEVVSGYAGGDAKTAVYEMVGTGGTGHAEAVRVTYDPAVISYGELLRVFFSVVHDPTQLNRQGPDVGPQYRSAIFYGSEEQRKAAGAYIEQLAAAKTFPRKIVTQVAPLRGFFPAEDYHQDFMAKHPDHPYIVYHDVPKVQHLKEMFPQYWRESTKSN